MYVHNFSKIALLFDLADRQEDYNKRALTNHGT